MARPNWVLGAGFTALFRGSLVSNIGDGMRLAAFPLLAASLTSSPFLIGAVTAAQYLPWLVFAPVGGVFVDRWDRRQTILVTQAARGLVMAVFLSLCSQNRWRFGTCVWSPSSLRRARSWWIRP